MAAGCLVVAAATRWLHGPAVLPLTALSVAAAIVVARTYAARGGRATDLDAAIIDEDAGLAGELRSATWFAALPERDTWAEWHVARAAARLRGISLPQLYPPVPARRAQLTTAAFLVLTVGTLALSMTSPSAARPDAATSPKTSALPKSSPGLDRPEAALPELQKQLEALLVAAETGVRLPTDMREIAADQRRLIAGIEALRAAGRLADLAHALAPASGARKDSPAAEVTALAERIRAAARRPNVAPEVREALEKVSETLSEDGGKLGSPERALAQRWRLEGLERRPRSRQGTRRRRRVHNPVAPRIRHRRRRGGNHDVQGRWRRLEENVTRPRSRRWIRPGA